MCHCSKAFLSFWEMMRQTLVLCPGFTIRLVAPCSLCLFVCIMNPYHEPSIKVYVLLLFFRFIYFLLLFGLGEVAPFR